MVLGLRKDAGVEVASPTMAVNMLSTLSIRRVTITAQHEDGDHTVLIFFSRLY